MLFPLSSVRLVWVSGHSGESGNGIADELWGGFCSPICRTRASQPPGSRGGTLGRRSRAGYLSSTRRCPSLTGNQRRAQELILGPSLATKTRLLSHNRTQYRVIKGLLTRHNAITRHLYRKRLIGSPWCRKCGAEEETSAHVLWRCEALATLRYHLGFLFLDSENVRNLSLRAHWELY